MWKRLMFLGQFAHLFVDQLLSWRLIGVPCCRRNCPSLSCSILQPDPRTFIPAGIGSPCRRGPKFRWCWGGLLVFQDSSHRVVLHVVNGGLDVHACNAEMEFPLSCLAETPRQPGHHIQDWSSNTETKEIMMVCFCLFNDPSQAGLVPLMNQ